MSISSHRCGPWIRTAWFAAALAVVASSWGCGPDRPVARHFVLVTVDTWRADHFLGSRANRPLTPYLERFAAGSIVFSRAESVANCTSPGVAGILSGLVPQRSGVISNAHVFPDEVPTLAITLRDNGFETAAFVANPVLGSRYGFARGFGNYEVIPRTKPHAKARGSQITAAGLAWLDARASTDGRVFLWLHYLEPHGPYEPPPEVLELFPKDAFFAARDIALLHKNKQSGWAGIPFYQQAIDAEDLHDGREYLARYAAEVRSLDGDLAELFAGLEQRGILQDAVVVVTSDHGEALAGDHGYYFSHANGLTEDQTHVPLLLRLPASAGATVRDQPVSTADIAPTALALLGVATDREFDGRDLLDAGSDERIVAAQAPNQYAIRRGPWKLAVDGDETRLFDLDADPGEQRDLADAQPEVRAELERELAALREIPPLADPPRRKID